MDTGKEGETMGFCKNNDDFLLILVLYILLVIVLVSQNCK
jgi:hypothetical protein